MRQDRRLRVRTSLASLALTAALASSLLLSGTTGATLAQDITPPPAPPEQFITPGKTAADKISSDLKALLRNTNSNSQVKIILQQNRPATRQLLTLLSRSRVLVKRQFSMLNAMALDVPAGLVAQLAAADEVETISPDRPVVMLGHLSAATGADTIRTLPATKGSGTVAVDGTGVGIAVLDS
ncbi:MAG TPA: hypothetical protein VGV59_06740, partial [Pyrinomonadaceae bacterium]|nr:hypothetical protein [Pyrinomonadaceae bacterium]